MPDILFIGDEVTACGFRLAGIPVAVATGDVAPLFQKALESCWLILMTTDLARQLPQAQIEEVYARGHPLLLLLPNATGRQVPEDIGQQLHTLIGPGP